MNHFDAWGIARLLYFIDDKKTFAARMCDGGLRDDELDAETIKSLVEPTLMMAAAMSQRYQFQATYDRVWAGGGPFYMAIKVRITWQELLNELTVLRQAVESDLEKHTFAFVPPEKAKVLNRIEEWKPIGEAVPESQTDIHDAIECYALEQNTASVFHLMRTVEWGLRAFCYHLGFKNVRSTIKKTGKVEVTPIEYSTWEGILSQLRGRITDKLNRVRRGVRKQQLQEFYNSAVSEVEAFKDAWRNHVMHTRRVYTAEDAQAIMAHVKRFMSLLVTNGVTKA
jgi:hypothetical protein